jgi:hypothetical protein
MAKRFLSKFREIGRLNKLKVLKFKVFKNKRLMYYL